MPEVLGDHIPSPRAALFWNGAAWQWALVAPTGHLRIDVMGSALPAGAATAANQALILAQVQLIEDLRDALQSVATDRLQVRGEDQLHSFAGVLAEGQLTPLAAAGGYAQSDPCPAGTIWHVTNIYTVNVISPTTRTNWYLWHDGVPYYFHSQSKACAINEPWLWRGDLWLDPSDTIRIQFVGSLLGDNCYLDVTGETMTLET